MKSVSLNDILPTIGATTSIGGSVASFFQYANPVLQFLSLSISIVVGILTIVYLIKKK